ncbi:MAG: CDP-alcohol phosphatidyltransferase family protein, partial [Deltaproteobacteria bacterium]|nr:CDP-alcohol phosphatidyltransferase family protein [Deltaproteobacteria bacterium]
SCDALDGQIARQTDKKSQFGAFMDSTLDRYSDMFPLLGIAYYFAGGPAFYGSASGTQGGDCAYWTVIITPERITLLIIGSLLGAIPGIGTLLMKATLIVLALSTNVTAVHRMVYVKQQLLRENQPK